MKSTEREVIVCSLKSICRIAGKPSNYVAYRTGLSIECSLGKSCGSRSPRWVKLRSLGGPPGSRLYLQERTSSDRSRWSAANSSMIDRAFSKRVPASRRYSLARATRHRMAETTFRFFAAPASRAPPKWPRQSIESSMTAEALDVRTHPGGHGQRRHSPPFGRHHMMACSSAWRP